MKKIYLDQLHWIELSRCINGIKTKEGTNQAYDFIIELSQSNRAIFPLSISHYYETLKATNPDRRKKLAEIMRSISKGYTTASLDYVVRHEVRTALALIFNLDVELNKFNYLGKGFEHALGHYIYTCTENTIKKHNKLEYERAISDVFENFFLSGVLNERVDSLVKPDLSFDNKFKEHLECWKGCASGFSKEELRKKIYTITYNDIVEPIKDGLLYFGISIERFHALGDEGKFQLLDNMPTRLVDMHLRNQWAQNSELTPKTSDLNDWSHIGSAVCYCDGVITEKQMGNMLSRSVDYSNKVKTSLVGIFDFFKN